MACTLETLGAAAVELPGKPFANGCGPCLQQEVAAASCDVLILPTDDPAGCEREAFRIGHCVCPL